VSYGDRSELLFEDDGSAATTAVEWHASVTGKLGYDPDVPDLVPYVEVEALDSDPQRSE
jgi:hypothetical protein